MIYLNVQRYASVLIFSKSLENTVGLFNHICSFTVDQFSVVNFKVMAPKKR